MKICWDDQLTDKEVYYLGKIVAHWGAIEYEVFSQTLQTFEDTTDDPSELPKAMKNLNFTSVLELWEQRVVNNAPGKAGEVLHAQLQAIKDAHDFRNTLIHSMLHVSPDDIGRIVASRVKKSEYIQIDITGNDLVDFYRQLGQINMNLRSPGGLEDIVKKRTELTGGFSRRGLALVSGHEVLSDWISSPAAPELSDE